MVENIVSSQIPSGMIGRIVLSLEIKFKIEHLSEVIFFKIEHILGIIVSVIDFSTETPFHEWGPISDRSCKHRLIFNLEEISTSQ